MQSKVGVRGQVRISYMYMVHVQLLGGGAPPSNFYCCNGLQPENIFVCRVDNSKYHPAIHTLEWNTGMRLYLSDDSDEVLEQTLSPLVSDHSCCHVAEDVGTARLDSI